MCVLVVKIEIYKTVIKAGQIILNCVGVTVLSLNTMYLSHTVNPQLRK